MSEVQHYLHLKQRISAFLSQNPDAMHKQRDWSEGLAHFFEIESEEWSYASLQDGWTFSQQESGERVFLSQREFDEGLASSFNARELYEYLCCLPQHEQLTPIVVDMWLTNACMRGKASEARGQYALA